MFFFCEFCIILFDFSNVSLYVSDIFLIKLFLSFESNEELLHFVNNSLYVNSSSLSSNLSNYVTSTNLTNNLANYVTSTNLTNNLANYVTSTNLTNNLANYVTTTNLTNNLANYITTDDLNTTLDGYVQYIDFANLAYSIIPASNGTYSLGNSTHQWKDLYVTGNTIYIDNVPLTISNGNLYVNNAPITPSANIQFLQFSQTGFQEDPLGPEVHFIKRNNR